MKATMNFEIPNLTVCLCEDDRARLDKIIELLNSTKGCSCQTPTAPTAESLEGFEPVKATDNVPEGWNKATETPKPAEHKELPPEPVKAQEKAKTEAQVVTVQDVQSKVVQLVRAGKKAEAQAIVNDYATNVSSIPGEKLAEALERLNALGV